MGCFKPLNANIIRYKYKKNEVEILPGKTPGNSLLPCGRCVGCRLKYSSDWANRCYLESKNWKFNYFLTLTYNPDNLPVTSSGEPTLLKKEISSFMKNLRMYYKYHFGIDTIRFFGCGEYGEKKGRPHYHIIIFNLPIPDLKVLNYNFAKDLLFTSDIINKIWKKGFVVIGNANWETIAYTARYVLKKQINKKDKSGLQEPEYVRMSRNPGIGKYYYEKNKDDIYSVDGYYILKKSGVIKSSPASYFDRLYEKENPERLLFLKEKRLDYIERKIETIEKDFGIPYHLYLSKELDDSHKKSKLLKRHKVLL